LSAFLKKETLLKEKYSFYFKIFINFESLWFKMNNFSFCFELIELFITQGANQQINIRRRGIKFALILLRDRRLDFRSLKNFKWKRNNFSRNLKISNYQRKWHLNKIEAGNYWIAFFFFLIISLFYFYAHLFFIWKFYF